jgi:hypothetical protein
VFDLAAKRFGKHEETAVQAALQLPAPGAGLQPIGEPFPDVDVSGARWIDESCRCTRGLLVLRTAVQKSRKRTLVMRLSERRAAEPPPDAEINGLMAPVAWPKFATEPAELRLFGIARQASSLRPGYVAIRALARFDPRRPPVYEDEERASQLNEALKGRGSRRRAAFGVDRPFRVEWDLVATRKGDGSVPISLAGLEPSPSQVQVVAWRGPATSEVVVNGRALVRAEKDVLVSLGEIWLAVPEGVTVEGKGRIVYEGTTPLDLLDLSAGVGGAKGPVHATMAFRLPARRYAPTQAWDLVQDVLEEIDPAAAAVRLATLQKDACWPAAAGPCHGSTASPQLGEDLADPARRWTALRELSAGGRPEARFVRLFARALVWDGFVGEEERLLLQRLLTRAEPHAGPSAE